MLIEPGNNINSSGGATGKARQANVRSGDSGTDSKTGEAAGASADKSAHKDNVSLSNTGQSLSRIEAAVSAASEVDTNKLADIKSAVENGTYQLNPYALAEKMLAQDDLF